MKLYRYRQANINNFGEIAEKRAWHSKYAELNDPFEGAYINKSNDAAFDQLMSQFRVCCFSEKHDNLLLWAHYAENHMGFCIEYDIPDESCEKECFAVKYTNELPVVERVERYPEGAPNAGKLKIKKDDFDVFLTKSRDWEYERE